MMNFRANGAALVGGCVFLLTFVAAPAGDAQPTGKSEGTFIDRVDVNIVNVEVFVTDKKGRAILGLAKEDFEVTVDGQAIEVSNFYAEQEDRPVYEGAGIAPLRTSPAGGDAEVEAPPQQTLRLLVFVDQTALQPLSRKRSFKSIRRFLAKGLAPADEIAVVSLAPGLKFHTDFTSDRSVIEDILKRLEKSPPLDLGNAAQRRQVLQEISGGGPQGRASAFDQMASSASSRGVLSMIRAVAASEYNLRK